MREWKLCLSLALASLPTLALAANAPQASHLLYFGHYPSSNPEGDLALLDDTADYANIAFFGGSRYDADAFFARAARHRTQAIVWIDVDPEDPVAWAKFVRKLGPYLGQIAAFLVWSEPDEYDVLPKSWCPAGGCHPGLCRMRGGVCAPGADEWPGVKAGLERWIGVIRATFGEKTPAVWVNYTTNILSIGDWELPSGTDVVSFDNYEGWERTTSGLRLSIPDYVALLKRKAPGQAVVLIPQGVAYGQADVDTNLTRARQYYDYAKSDPAVVGILPWEWWSTEYDRDGRPVIDQARSKYAGTRDTPRLREAWMKIGREITGRRARAPRLASVTPDSFSSLSAPVLSFRGWDFAPGAMIAYRGEGRGAVAAQFISPEELRLPVPAGAAPGIYWLAVQNPGGTRSAETRIVIAQPQAALSSHAR